MEKILRKNHLMPILLILLMFANIASGVWLYPDVDIVAGNFTLNVKSAQNFTSIEIGETSSLNYTNLSWNGITYHNITYISNITSSQNVIELNGICDLGIDETNISYDVYAPIDWTVTTNITVITWAPHLYTYPVTSYVQSNVTHRKYTIEYNPPNSLVGGDMGYFSVNVSVYAENATLTYTGYKLKAYFFEVIRLDPPYGLTSEFNTTYISINASWTSGNNSDNDVVIRNNNTYPLCPSGGYEVQNSSNNYCNLSVTPNDGFYLAIFSYNDTTKSYSNPLYITWGAIQVQCFNESNPSQAINFDIEITNDDATEVYAASDVSNGMSISFGDIPYGDNTVIILSNSSYKLRTYYKDLDINHFYNYTFYLPPIETESEEPPETGEGTLRAYTDVKSVTDPSSDVTVSLTHTLNEIIDVSIFSGIGTSTLLSYTDVKSVTDPSSDVTVSLTHVMNEMIGVYVYNISGLYPEWVLVPNDNYTISGNDIIINQSVLNDNTTMAKVIYYYIDYSSGTIYHEWILVPNDNYTISGNDIIINQSVLNVNTTMAKVSYYYMDYDNMIDTQLYVLTVVGPQGEYTSAPIEKAKIIIKRYMNTTDSYEEITSLLTDANGNAEVYLIPETNLKVFISKEGYESSVSNFIPNIYIPTKTFRIYPLSPVYPDYPTFSNTITFNATKYANNSMKVIYIDHNENTTNAQFYTYEFYNGIYTLNATNTTTNDTFIFWVTGLNSSRSHIIILHLNHSTLGYVNETLYVGPYYEPKLDKTQIENVLIGAGGYFRLGYVTTFFIYLPAIVGLIIAGKGHPGFGIIIAALYLGFVNVFLSSPIVFVPFIMAIGLVLMAVKGGKIKL